MRRIAAASLWLAVMAGVLTAAEPERVLKPADLPPDAALAISIRPTELAKHKLFAPHVAAFDKVLESSDLKLSVADIESLLFVMLGMPDQRNGDADILTVVRTVKPYNWKAWFGGPALVEKVIDGHTVFHTAADKDWLVRFPDDRTMVYAVHAAMPRTWETPNPDDRESWAERWAKVADLPLAGLLQMNMLGMFGIEDDLEDEESAPYRPLLVDARTGVLGAKLNENGLEVHVELDTYYAEDAPRVAQAAAYALTQLANGITNDFDSDAVAAGKLREQLLFLLAQTKIVSQDTLVTIDATAMPSLVEATAAVIRASTEEKPAPAVAEADADANEDE